jgi:hypothetical protein
MVKEWLEYAADTNYPVKNNGMVLSPSGASNVIKAFYSSVLPDENVRPKLQIIVTKNNDTDTLTTTTSATLSLINADIPPSTETFPLQAGVGYIQVMKFDLSKLPSTATINDVQLYVTLDSVNSIFSNQTVYKVFSHYINDSNGIKTDLFPFEGSNIGNGQYMIRLVSTGAVSPFQRWLLGEANYGLALRPSEMVKNLDLFRFYDITAGDPNKRPRVIIRYTPRVIP